jgi:hypothetical protein
MSQLSSFGPTQQYATFSPSGDGRGVVRLLREATRRDERQALGYFLELAGRLGGEARLVKAARGYLMNMGVDSFRSTFDKFARP